MKTFFLFSLCVMTFLPTDLEQSSAQVDLEVLVGSWQLDMTPQDPTDSNFATMHITEIEGTSFKGEFYRDGVKIRHAQINTQLGIIYGALISKDNSGEYNTSFYYKEGKLHGSTHAVKRNFLSVWTATKDNE